MDSIFNISTIDGRYREQIPKKLRNLLSEYGLISQRLRVEIEWVRFLHPELTKEQHASLNTILDSFDESQAMRIKKIEKTTKHDVKALEYYLVEECKKCGLDSLITDIHITLTSEDVNNLSYALILTEARNEIISLLSKLQDIFKNFATTYSRDPIMSRTHGQPATPTTLGKEMANYYSRLTRVRRSFEEVEILGKCNGAVGNYAAMRILKPKKNPQDIIRDSSRFIKSLGLMPNHYTTQVEPGDWLAQYLHAVARISVVLLDVSRDIWLYISYGYFILKNVEGEIGSSTMPHKVNPIHFENSEGNLQIAISYLNQLSTILPVSRLQRDLSNSTSMRNIGVALSHTVIAIKNQEIGLQRITFDRNRASDELQQHWELLAEAIQTQLRANGDTHAYEKMKEASRGKKFNQEDYLTFIKEHGMEEQLGMLTPQTYRGIADYLALNLDDVLAEERK